MASADLITKLAGDRTFNLRLTDYSVEKTVYTSETQIVFEVKKRTDPAFNTEKNELEEDAWSHSTNIRLTKLTGEEQVKNLLELFDVRKALDTEECGFLLPFHDQGFVDYAGSIWYAERYDNPERNFEYWINFDHQGLEIDVLDVYRLARGPLDAFKWLEENNYTLTQFDEQNLYVGSFSEDRANFFRVMFKGNKGKAGTVDLGNKTQFSAPESQTTDIYKTYSFKVGLFVLWAVLSTNNKAGEFPKDIHSNPDKLPNLIKTVADLCYKDGGPNASLKEAFIVFLEDLLQTDIAKRQTAANLLTYKWVQECERLDYEEYQKEVEEYQKALAKEREEEEKNR